MKSDFSAGLLEVLGQKRRGDNVVQSGGDTETEDEDGKDGECRREREQTAEEQRSIVY